MKRCQNFYWSLWKLSSRPAQSSSEVMAVFDCSKFCWNNACLHDYYQRLLNVLLKWRLFQKVVDERLLKVLLKWWLFEYWEKKMQKKDYSSKSSEKLIKYILSVWDTGIAPAHLANLSLFCTWRTFKIGVKWKFLIWPSDPFVTSDVSDAQNWGKMQIFAPARATFS